MPSATRVQLSTSGIPYNAGEKTRMRLRRTSYFLCFQYFSSKISVFCLNFWRELFIFVTSQVLGFWTLVMSALVRVLFHGGQYGIRVPYPHIFISNFLRYWITLSSLLLRAPTGSLFNVTQVACGKTIIQETGVNVWEIQGLAGTFYQSSW